MEQQSTRPTLYLRAGKRIFDLSLSLICVVILAVPALVITVLVLIFSGRPIFFTQERIGRGGHVFRIVKFRTMTTDASYGSTITVAGDARLTLIGRWLRYLKLDEIPQLWNVLKGEMSFVGPRPDVPGYADKLTGEMRRILILRPGITGPASLAYRHEEQILAQVPNPKEYNDTVIYPHKVSLNLAYLDNCSLSTDIYYLYKTVLSVLS